MNLRKITLSICLSIITTVGAAQHASTDKEIVDSMKVRFQNNTHKVLLDDQSKIISWLNPQVVFVWFT